MDVTASLLTPPRRCCPCSDLRATDSSNTVRFGLRGNGQAVWEDGERKREGGLGLLLIFFLLSSLPRLLCLHVGSPEPPTLAGSFKKLRVSLKTHLAGLKSQLSKWKSDLGLIHTI